MIELLPEHPSISQPVILIFKLDFLDKDGAHNADSGIVGKISSRYFGCLPPLSAMQAGSCFSRELGLGKNVSGVQYKRELR